MISVRLDIKDLVEKQACQGGQDLFRQIVAHRGWKHSIQIKNWTPLHDVWLAWAYPGFAGWLREQRLIPLANLRGADLYGANLRGANLRGADLRWANLYGANLYGADLRWANLYGANLYGADLRGANLYGADLYGADLRGAYSDSAPEGWRLENGILVPSR